MNSNYLTNYKSTLLRCSQVMLVLGLFSSAHSADLSEGLKGLKLGVTKSEAFAILNDQEQIFAPHCETDPHGELCTTLISNLTYGSIPLMTWRLHFWKDGRLDRVMVLLTKSGCGGSTDVQHPRSQFGSLSARLKEHYGKPLGSQENSMVWLDNISKALLVLALNSEPIPGIGYPNCPVTSVSLTTVEYMKILSKIKGSAKESDL